MACQQILRFSEAVAILKMALEYDKNQEIKNELEEAESYLSNYERYQAGVASGDFKEALSCVNYISNKIPNSEKLKEYKVECLAKTGETTEALTLVKSIRVGMDQQNPDFWYLKGIIELYGGESGRAKKFFVEGMRLDPDNQKCKKALHNAKQCEKLKEEGNEFIKANNY